MFHFWFQCFIFYLPRSFPKKLSGRKIKPQWKRFKTSMGEKSNPNGRNTTETLKSKMKHRMPMFHLLKVLIINALCYENETWNKKTSQGKYYVRARKERVLTGKQRVLTSRQRVLTWGRRVASAPIYNIYAWNKRTYIYAREIIPFMFFSTKHKKIVPIICSFKAENVLLPCYSFPAKKSLKKVSFFKSLVYNVLRI